MNKKLKNELRAQFKAKRDAIPKDEREQLSKKILENLFQSDFWKGCSTITSFVSFASEPDTHQIIREAILQNKKIAVPRVISRLDELGFFYINDFERDLRIGRYGILEPLGNLNEIIEPTSFQIHIIPGIVFDKKGYRIGFGKGYYDRFLKKISPYAVKIALAFKFQIIEKIPHEKADIPVDIIITEERINILHEIEDFREFDFHELF